MPVSALVAAMAGIVLASNVLVQFVLPGGLLTWGAFTYPFAFLATDLANRLHGPRAARRVVLGGFAAGVAFSLAGSQVMVGDAPLVPLRIAVASGTAFLLAQGLDVALFAALRGGVWWRAPLVSSLAASALDTALFFAIAFSAAAGGLFPSGANAAVAWASEPAPLLALGPPAPLWISLALADFGVKVALALVALGPYRLVVRRWTQAGT